MPRRRRTRRDPMDDVFRTTMGATKAVVGLSVMSATASTALQLMKKKE